LRRLVVDGFRAVDDLLRAASFNYGRPDVRQGAARWDEENANQRLENR
jgi:hypothetical protein